MSDLTAGEVPEIAIDHEFAPGVSLGPEKSGFVGMVGASDTMAASAIPHLKDSETHLMSLFGVLDSASWTDMGIELRRGEGLSPAARHMMRTAMAEVVYQMKARHNGLTFEDQGLVSALNGATSEVERFKRARARRGDEETIAEASTTQLETILMSVLDGVMSFESLDQLRGLANEIAKGLREGWK